MKRQLPVVITPRGILRTDVLTEISSGAWVPARSASLTGNPICNLWRRVKLAALVFIGRYDALDWEY